MDSEHSTMDNTMDLDIDPNRSHEEVEHAPTTEAEPSISFDFVSTDFEFPSTDDGSQDVANAALIALSDDHAGDEQIVTETLESQLPEETVEEDAEQELENALQSQLRDEVLEGEGEQQLEDALEEAFKEGLEEKSSLVDVDTTPPAPNSIFVSPSDPKPLPIEVAIPEMTAEQRAEYSIVESDVIEAVLREDTLGTGDVSYRILYTDGREDQLLHHHLLGYDNGEAALMAFYERSMPRLGKRKRSDVEEWDSEQDSDPDSDLDRMEVDEDDSAPRHRYPPRRSAARSMRSHRSRETSIRQMSQAPSAHSNRDEEAFEENDDSPVQQRVLRHRPPRQQSRNPDDIDELAADSQGQSEAGDAKFIPQIMSDIHQGKRRPRPRKLQPRSARQQAAMRQRSPDSDIEFEAPRRSNRSTRNRTDMRDDAEVDEDSFYVNDDKGTGVPKVISIREVFQPTPLESAFASVHIDTCHTCNGSRQRGQLIYCQGCSLSYHKNCLGYRSAREHMVTKVGDEDFVLQCRFCINIYGKKDSHAPKHDMCQGCKESGKSCAAFSSKKTSRQEEKLREENGGADPITQVAPGLLNNSENILFRCVKCHRGWHIKHLPPAGSNSLDQAGTDLREERLKDYSIDWECNDCSLAKQKIHRLVAWRPVRAAGTVQTTDVPRLLASQVPEDDKEYLVKWENTSYFHCVWKPGAWIYGAVAAAMRHSFLKRDFEQGLQRSGEKDAIPDEFLMPDVILNVKMDSSAPKGRSKHEDFENIGHVRKILVKFQGLGYDDVVWDSPPRESMGSDIWTAYVEAYFDYLEGKYFQSEPQSRIRERIKGYKNAPFEEVDQQPAGLKRGKLMGYQVEGLNWMLENYRRGRSIVLADEMGLGKTVQVVSLVASLVQDKPKCWPFLIVVPNATCPNWRREFKQWTPDLRVVTYHGGKAPQELAYKYELFPGGTSEMKAHVVIMSYDSASDPQTKLLFKSVHWTGLVVDEGQRLKNDQNLLYLALRSMKIPFRLLLTGTPLQNNKRELFNLLQFIDESQDAAKLDQEYEVLNKDNLPKLHEKIRPYFLRRTKAGVLKFLPPMAQIILPVTMTVIQEKLAKSIMAKNPQLIKAMFANGKMNKKERGSLNNILMQLRKVLCHPFVYSDAIEERHHDSAVLQQNLVEASAKLLLLQIMLPKLQERGHRVLIFSQFLQQLDIIEDFLSGMGFGFRRLDGTLSSLEKQRRIDAFNAPGSDLFAFLLSTRSGGVGINLATADTVIIMDPDFNPHQDIQALSRAHRIGQQKKVLCFQLVTKDSVEEKIMQIGRKKMALDHALIESMDDNDLGGDDLESILKHGAQALFNENHPKESIQYDATSVEKLLDRSEIEQAQTTEEGSTEFTYAKVWANEASGFEGTLGAEETAAPEPMINSSVWDRILAQREEEARKEAEADKEVLGRGGRRRGAAVTYNNSSKGMQIAGLEDIGPDSAVEDSDEYPGGAESPDESEDDAAASAQGKKRHQTIAPTQTKTPAGTPFKKHTSPKKQTPVKRQGIKNNVNNCGQQTRKSTPSSHRKQPDSKAFKAKAQPDARPKTKTNPRQSLSSKPKEAEPRKASSPSSNPPTPRKTPIKSGQTASKSPTAKPAARKTKNQEQVVQSNLETQTPASTKPSLTTPLSPSSVATSETLPYD